jgi:hypothetical protein
LVAENSLYFTPTQKHFDGYLAVEMLPARDDGIIGDQVSAFLNEPLRLADPPAPLDVDLGVPVVGQALELGETVSWLLSDPKAFCGFTEVRRGQSFVAKPEHVGRILRVVTDLSDTILGEVQPAEPVVTGLAIQAERPEVGLVASARIEPPTLARDQYQIIWVQVQGEFERAVAFERLHYTFQPMDIGFQIKLQVTTILNGQLLVTTDSPLTQTIHDAVNTAPQIEGAAEEGSMLELVYHREVEDVRWLRSDKKEKWVEIATAMTAYTTSSVDLSHYIRVEFRVGNSILFATTSDAIRPKAPTVKLDKEREAACEGDLLTPFISYLGGKEGKSLSVWSRNSPEQPAKLEEIAQGKTYRLMRDDCDCNVSFTYTPVRNDGVQGIPSTIVYGPVQALPPSVSKVIIVQNGEG